MKWKGCGRKRSRCNLSGGCRDRSQYLAGMWKRTAKHSTTTYGTYDGGSHAPKCRAVYAHCEDASRGCLNRQLPRMSFFRTMQACEAARTAAHARQPWRHLVLLLQCVLLWYIEFWWIRRNSEKDRVGGLSGYLKNGLQYGNRLCKMWHLNQLKIPSKTLRACQWLNSNT
jgi:hypothetical protein